MVKPHIALRLSCAGASETRERGTETVREVLFSSHLFVLSREPFCLLPREATTVTRPTKVKKEEATVSGQQTERRRGSQTRRARVNKQQRPEHKQANSLQPQVSGPLARKLAYAHQSGGCAGHTPKPCCRAAKGGSGSGNQTSKT